MLDNITVMLSPDGLSITKMVTLSSDRPTVNKSLSQIGRRDIKALGGEPLVVLRKKLSDNLRLEVRGGRERQRWHEERVLTVGLILMRLRR